MIASSISKCTTIGLIEMNDNQEVKIGMTDGDDRNELQPSCMRAPSRDVITTQITKDLDDFLMLVVHSAKD